MTHGEIKVQAVDPQWDLALHKFLTSRRRRRFEIACRRREARMAVAREACELLDAVFVDPTLPLGWRSSLRVLRGIMRAALSEAAAGVEQLADGSRRPLYPNWSGDALVAEADDGTRWQLDGVQFFEVGSVS